MMMVFLLAVLQKILRQIAQDPTTDGAQKPMPCLLAEHVTRNTATNRAQKASLAFSHGRCVGVIVGRIRVGGLWCELMLLLSCVRVIWWLWLLLARLHALLIGLVLGIGIVVTVLRSRRTAIEVFSVVEVK